jgi:hypothetical protein
MSLSRRDFIAAIESAVPWLRAHHSEQNCGHFALEPERAPGLSFQRDGHREGGGENSMHHGTIGRRVIKSFRTAKLAAPAARCLSVCPLTIMPIE